MAREQIHRSRELCACGAEYEIEFSNAEAFESPFRIWITNEHRAWKSSHSQCRDNFWVRHKVVTNG